MKCIPRNFLALSSFGFSIIHFSFALRFDVCISGHKVSGLEIFSSLSLRTMKIHPVNLVELSTYLTIRDLHQHSNSRRYFSRAFTSLEVFCRPGNVEIFQWDRIFFFFQLHHLTAMSLVGLKKMRLVLLQDFLVLLLGVGDTGSRWMFSEPNLLQRVLPFHLRLGKTFHHSWALTLPFH